MLYNFKAIKNNQIDIVRHRVMDYSQFGRIQTASKRINTGSTEFGVSSRRQGKMTTGRPSTGLKGANFQSSRQNRLGSPSIQDEDPLKKMETQILSMLSDLYDITDLKKAKICLQTFTELSKHKSSTDLKWLNKQVNMQHALQLELIGDYSQAIVVYQSLITDKLGQLPDIYLVNIARNYYKLQDYTKSIKFYQMAHDKLPFLEYKLNCLKSIGIIHMQLNHYNEAVNVYQNVLTLQFDLVAATNLLICLYKLEKFESIKKCFVDFISIEEPYIIDKSTVVHDEYNDLCGSFASKYEKLILLSVKMLVQLCPPLDHVQLQTIDFCIEKVKQSDHTELVHVIELFKCFRLLLLKNSSDAIDMYKSFELKEMRLRSAASNNLTFLYLIQKDLINAEKYCSMVLDQDMYNSKALVNMGCIYYEKSNFNSAIEYFNKALSCDSLCISALYNLALVKTTMQQHEGYKLFEKLTLIHSTHHEALFQLVSSSQNKDLFNRIVALCDSDSQILFMVGKQQKNIEMILESYRLDPTHQSILLYLGNYYENEQLFEKSKFFYNELVELYGSNEHYFYLATITKLCGNFVQAYKLAKTAYALGKTQEIIDLLVQLSQDLNQDVGKWNQE